MESVAMHPPKVTGASSCESPGFASSPRPRPISAGDTKAAYTSCPSSGPSHSGDPVDQDGQGSRQDEVPQSVLSQGEKQSSSKGLPGLDQIPELASMKAVPDIRQALASPAAENVKESELSCSNEVVDAGSEQQAAEVGDKSANAIVHPASGHEPELDVASPASSSEDAPGSDYEDFEDHRDAHGHSPPTDPQTEPGVEQSMLLRMPLHTVCSNAKVFGHAESGDANRQGKEDRSNTATETRSQDLEVPQSTPVWLSEFAAPAVSKSQSPDIDSGSNGIESVDKEGTGLRISELLDRIGESTTASDQEVHSFRTHQDSSRATPPLSSHQRSEQSHATLVHSLEEDDNTPVKRMKLDDATRPSGEAAASEHGYAPSNQSKAPASKATVAPKAAPKPKKETKAKGKMQQTSTSPVAFETGAQQASDPTRRLDAAPREKGLEVEKAATTTSLWKEAVVPGRPQTDPPQKTESLESADGLSGTGPTPAILLNPSNALVHVSGGTGAPGEAKLKPKSKMGSRGKEKAASKSFDPTTGRESGPVVEMTAAPKQGPIPKPASARSKAKKGKGPVARLAPAQADGAVSELELEPPKQETTGAPSLTETQSSSTTQPGMCTDQVPTSEQRDFSRSDQPLAATDFQHQQEAGPGRYMNTSIFSSMPPPMYPAQAYYPTRAQQAVRQHSSGLSSLTNAAFLLDSDLRWAESTFGKTGAPSSSYEGINEPTNPTVHTSGDVTGGVLPDRSRMSEQSTMSGAEINPLFVPPGWRYPTFDVIDPDTLMTKLRERTVWTFWDCYFPLGCRDQDLVIMSNDGVAFPCAAWNPCLFSSILKRVIQNPSPEIRQILARGAEQNRKIIGYQPVPCIMVDETWHATNFLLSFLHPIPTIFLPDRLTCRLVYEVGMRYGVERAIQAAGHRISQIEEEDSSADAAKGVRARNKAKGKARGSEEEIAKDLADRAAEGARG